MAEPVEDAPQSVQQEQRAPAAAEQNAEAGEDSEVPPQPLTKTAKWRQLLSVGAVGGVQVKSPGCQVCGAQRQEGQRGRACPVCVKWCRKLFLHQRISQVLEVNSQDVRQQIRAKSLEERARAGA